jgi:nitroimidazol reductase NimA-like FMN-containing flavoprotein (pyridoxamine 5'-phosphate oxidase superfamily)
MDPDELWDWVSAGHTGIFVTLTRDGTPIAMPLWYVVLDRRIYTHSGGKKLQRIRHNPRAAFLVESGVRWTELKAVHMTGRLRALEPSEEIWQQVHDAMDAKYAAFRLTREQLPSETARKYETDGRRYLEFSPDDRILNWDNSKLGLT